MMIHGYRNGDQVEGAEVGEGDRILIDMMAAASYFLTSDPLDMVTCQSGSGQVGVWASRFDGWRVRLGCNRYLYEIMEENEKLRVEFEFGSASG